ncbi:MAG: hypothetical protein ACI8P9_005068 [Parasphingorhabdus sp.]|jgi:hypothetical protein
MRRFVVVLGLLCIPVLGWSSPWTFKDPIDITEQVQPARFHHLDGAGRRHLALSASQLAVVWEDDRSGDPQVYLATKVVNQEVFSKHTLLSSGDEAYEPSIAALETGGFVVAWEQDGQIWVRFIKNTMLLGEPVNLSRGSATQVSLVQGPGNQTLALWASIEGQKQLIKAGVLTVDDGTIIVAAVQTVASVESPGYQAYPDGVFTLDGYLIAWEDRRAGHTRLLGSYLNLNGQFQHWFQLNEHRANLLTESALAGGGSGVMRISLAARDRHIQAVWLDKRDPGSGYAVWGAYRDNGGTEFSPNHKIQDAMGSAVAQWHASIISSLAGFVSVWDDSRESWADETESGDIFISWQTNNGWSEDLAVPGASGDGYQGSPVLVSDTTGDLHLVWIERDDIASAGKLRYLHGTLNY